MSFGEVGEDGTWRLRLNEFAHVLKLASRVPPGVEGTLQRRLDNLPYNARQVGAGVYAGRNPLCSFADLLEWVIERWAGCRQDA